MKILALEQSTSSAKALLYDTSQRRVLSVVTKQYNADICDVYTQDARGIFDCLMCAANELLDVVGRDVDAISLSSIWPCLLLLDKNGQPLTRVITWADTSCAPTVKRYKHLAAEVYAKTGCTVHSIYGIWKYMHLKRTCPELIKRVGIVTNQGGFLAYEMTGQNVCTASMASANGFLNMHTLKWDYESLELAGITADMLPRLCEADEILPLCESAAARLGLKAGLPVIPGGGDGALNQLGSGAVKSGAMTFSVGTSAAIRMTCPSAYTDDESLWCYYLTDGIRLAGAATSGACSCINWFKDKLFMGKLSFDELENALLNADKSDAPVFLPFLFGERCPGWDDQRRGGFYELDGTHGVGEMYYSVLEGVLFNVYQCYEKLIARVGEPEHIVISGGITHSSVWLKMAADIFKKPLLVSGEEHASTIGAVVLAMKALGIISSFEEYGAPVKENIEPDPAMRAHYERRYKKYLKAYNSEV